MKTMSLGDDPKNWRSSRNWNIFPSSGSNRRYMGQYDSIYGYLWLPMVIYGYLRFNMANPWLMMVYDD